MAYRLSHPHLQTERKPWWSEQLQRSLRDRGYAQALHVHPQPEAHQYEWRQRMARTNITRIQTIAPHKRWSIGSWHRDTGFQTVPAPLSHCLCRPREGIRPCQSHQANAYTPYRARSTRGHSSTDPQNVRRHIGTGRWIQRHISNSKRGETRLSHIPTAFFPLLWPGHPLPRDCPAPTSALQRHPDCLPTCPSMPVCWRPRPPRGRPPPAATPFRSPGRLLPAGRPGHQHPED